jgi:NADP-dependent 3-hydroxy acid dehydrogenase YdfG
MRELKGKVAVVTGAGHGILVAPVFKRISPEAQ